MTALIQSVLRFGPADAMAAKPRSRGLPGKGMKAARGPPLKGKETSPGGVEGNILLQRRVNTAENSGS